MTIHPTYDQRRATRLGRHLPALAIVLLVMATAAILLAMGRPPICTCGTIKLWHGMVNSAENSQHLADWYAPSHLIHGLIFYGAGRWLLRDRGFTARLAIAVALEAAWEIAENSPLIIDRYRSATMALGYTGDSVLNSIADIGWMAAGFVLARRLPLWASVTLAIALELIALAAIRDNLTLNVLMLVWPVEAIRTWQGA